MANHLALMCCYQCLDCLVYEISFMINLDGSAHDKEKDMDLQDIQQLLSLPMERMVLQLVMCNHPLILCVFHLA